MNVDAFDPVSVALLFAGLSLLPLFAVTTTAFLKITVVLLIVRNAMGIQQVPPTLVLYGIAGAITLYVMGPTFQEIGARLERTPPSTTSTDRNIERMQRAAEPMRDFMSKQVSARQLEWFLDAASRTRPTADKSPPQPSDWSVLVPAFVVSQLQAAYEVALAIYIPFLVIELVVSSVLLALGMQMVSPTVVTIPLKLMLFVAIDGWARLLHGLSLSFS
jgi:type III secretion protein R